MKHLTNVGRLAIPTPRSRMAGITLMELMVVVTVIGVLGMIALPSYRQYAMRAQRTEAKSALLQLATNQERFYLTNRTYGGDPSVLGFPSNQTERGVYTLSIAGANATGYTATATPRSGGAFDMTVDTQCATFSITAQGVRSATGTAPDSCW
jgi:type IV pilus assembly protein PilE